MKSNGGDIIERMTQPLLSFSGHLDEFRRRLLISLAAVTAGAAFCFVFIDEVMAVLLAPVRPYLSEIYFFSPADAFVIKIKAALLAGFVIASPLVACELWLFVSPALHAREKKALVPVVFAMSFLFLAGALFCFFSVLPVALDFLISQQTAYLKPVLSMNEYMGFLSGMVIAFGVAFNLPLAVVALVALGLARAATLARYQRHAVVLIFIAAAVLTPGPDMASQLLLAVPLVALFELSVAVSWLLEKASKKRRAAR